MAKFKYPLIDSINETIDNRNPALEEDLHVFQQSFLGLSIIDFSSTLGFNSDSSSITLNLIKDDVNFLTPLRYDGLRDAVTEGYHPWDTKAFPKPLIAGESPCATKEGKNAGDMGLTYSKEGDIECFPEPGSPVFFKYFDGSLLTEECIKEAPGTKEFCKNVFSFNGILSKWEKQYSTSGFTYSVNITDPREILENTIVILDGISNRVQPADTHVIKDSSRSYNEGWNGYYNIVNVFGYYEIHGFGSSDRSDLGMKWFDRDPKKPFPSQYLGVLNEAHPKLKNHAHGVFPALRLMLSGKNSKYIEDQEPFGGPLYYGLDNREIETPAPFTEGEIKDEAGDVKQEFNIHRYIVDLDDLEKLTRDSNSNPFVDSSGTESSNIPITSMGAGELPPDFHIEGDRLSLLQIIQQVCDAAGVDFQVKLLSLEEADVSHTHNPPWAEKSKHIDQIRNYSGVIKIIPLIKKREGNSDTIIRKAIDDSQETPLATGAFSSRGISKLMNASVGREFVDPIAGQILFGAPRTRVVGVTPLGDKKTRRELWFNNQTHKYNDPGNMVGKCFRKSDGQDTGHQDEDSCLADLDIGIPFCEARSKVHGAECKGYVDEFHCNEKPNCKWYVGVPINRWTLIDQNNAPIEGRDDILREFLPSIELDGVTLFRQKVPKDEFPDRDSRGWNPYGIESRKELEKKRDPTGLTDAGLKDFRLSQDFGKNLPPVSNDDYLPWIYPEDYSGGNGQEADPFQLNRANSRHHDVSGECDSEFCDRKADGNVCADEDGDVLPPDYDEEKCTDAGLTWVTQGSVITQQGVCNHFGGQWAKHSNNKKGCEAVSSISEFTKDFQESLSGYLDIFPCWGFKEKLFAPLNEEKKDLFDDIIDIKQQGKPIKGFFWDDDPYRDFHPTEGIFGSFEFYNPGLGECIDGTGSVIGALENKADICECDPDTAPPYSDCIMEGGVTGETKWRPYCIASFECRDSDGGLIDEIHPGTAGTGAKNSDGNNLVDIKYSCELGCFDLDPNSGLPTGKAIVAYYTKSITLAGTVYEQGSAAGVNDPKFGENVENGIVKFMGGEDECIASGKNRKALTNQGPDGGNLEEKPRASFPVNASGGLAAQGKGNSHKQFGGAYDKKCKAISFKFPWSACCRANSDAELDGRKYKKGSCTHINNKGDCDKQGETTWGTVSIFAPSMVDEFTGKEIISEDIPKPGYINVRHKVEGSCKRTVKLEGGGTKEEPIDIFPDPNETRTVEQICIAEGGEINTEARGGVFMPLHPRTATIPIDLSIIGYNGGPSAETNGVQNEFKGYYYATVTELRHAAVSQDSWVNYMREIQPLLACEMFAQTKSDVSKWKDYCSTVTRTIFKGGKSNAHIYAQSNLQHYGDSSQPGKLTAAALAHGGRPNHEDALALQGHICGDDPSNATLSIGQRTTMEVDLAYKKIREVATQFYGRKYLVPLPFNPPTAILCTNPEYKEKEDCERYGFDWGPHGLISSWFRTFGFGTCVDADGKAQVGITDKQTCESAKLAWIEPVQEANKWNIVSAGWPGGDVSVVFDTRSLGYSSATANIATGYPDSMNFWTDDGNLKSFVIFPEKDRRRFAGDAGENERLNFSAWDAEQVHISNINNPAADKKGADYGAKTFATVEVDPKTHWLNTRPDWEIQQEKQYYKFRAGDPTNAQGFPEGDQGTAQFLTVGPEPLKGGTCNGENGELPYYSSTDCAENGGTWEKNDEVEFDLQETLNARPVFIRKPDEITEYAAYKPYALITLPFQVYYGNIDRARKMSEPLGGNKNDVCIPLVSGRGRAALLNAWLQGMSPKNISVQQLIGTANIDKANAIVAPDTSRSDFISAAYKPWHAAIPQQSTTYKWGPWGGGLGYGRPDFQIDDQMHPAAFNGETKLAQVAMTRLAAVVRKKQAHIEAGSVTLTGFGHNDIGSCNIGLTGGINLWTKQRCEENGGEWMDAGSNYFSTTSGPGLGDQLTGVGPFITSISVQIGTGGIQVTYSLSTQRKFGELEKLQENRIRQSQKDITRDRVEGEKQLLRVKRGIDQYKK